MGSIVETLKVAIRVAAERSSVETRGNENISVHTLIGCAVSLARALIRSKEKRLVLAYRSTERRAVNVASHDRPAARCS